MHFNGLGASADNMASFRRGVFPEGAETGWAEGNYEFRKYSFNQYNQPEFECHLPRVLDGWYPTQNLIDIAFPIGYGGYSTDDRTNRILEYVPIVSAWIGVCLIANALKVIWNKVMWNDTLAFSIREYQNTTHHKIAIEYHIEKVELTCGQRLAILGFCILSILRGILDIFQLGLLLLPADIVYQYNRDELRPEIYQV